MASRTAVIKSRYALSKLLQRGTMAEYDSEFLMLLKRVTVKGCINADEDNGVYEGCCHGKGVEGKLNYLKLPIPAALVPNVTGQPVPPETLAARATWVKGQKEIDVLMLMTMEPDLQ
ncbi:hypothetical protein Tco_1427859 [Tanacetum coccineum]